jgi:hypothetical protein
MNRETKHHIDLIFFHTRIASCNLRMIVLSLEVLTIVSPSMSHLFAKSRSWRPPRSAFSEVAMVEGSQLTVWMRSKIPPGLHKSILAPFRSGI